MLTAPALKRCMELIRIRCSNLSRSEVIGIMQNSAGSACRRTSDFSGTTQNHPDNPFCEAIRHQALRLPVFCFL